jgi:YHS domain-containing protein
VHGHGGGDHTGHGGHGAPGDRSGEQGTPAADPVCGMEVAPSQGYTVTQAGRGYRLCLRACLDTFEATPGQYASTSGGAR